MHAIRPTIINTVSNFVWVAIFHRVATASSSHPDATNTLQCWFYLLLCGLQSSIASQLPRRPTPTSSTPLQCCSYRTTVNRRHSPCHRSLPGVGSCNLRQCNNPHFAMAGSEHKAATEASGVADAASSLKQNDTPCKRKACSPEIKNSNGKSRNKKNKCTDATPTSKKKRKRR